MTDDIVDRLYALHDQFITGEGPDIDIHDAILEIENLRHKLEVATVDIVIRLRNETNDFYFSELVLEAADEIERLRKELKGIQK